MIPNQKEKEPIACSGRLALFQGSLQLVTGKVAGVQLCQRLLPTNRSKLWALPGGRGTGAPDRALGQLFRSTDGG